MYFLGLLLPLAYTPTFNGVTSARWALLAVAIPLFLLWVREKRGLAKPPAGFVLLFALLFGHYALFSSFALAGLDDFIHLCILFGAFYLGMHASDLRDFWLGLALGVTINAALMVAQMLGYSGIEQTAAPAGLFRNSNVVAEAACIALLVAGYYRMWWLLPGAQIAIVLSGSKAAFGAAVVSVLFLFMPGRWRYLAPALAGVIGVTFFLHSTSMSERALIWLVLLDAVNWTGHGIGSYFAAHTATGFAHNEYLQMWYEWGLFCLPVFLVFYKLMRKEPSLEQSIIFCVMGLSFFAFPLHMPVTACCFTLAAGRMYSRWYAVCRPFDAGRDHSYTANKRDAHVVSRYGAHVRPSSGSIPGSNDYSRHP